MPNPPDPASLVDVAMTIASRPLSSTPSPSIPGPRPETPYQAPDGPSPLRASRVAAKAAPRGAK